MPLSVRARPVQEGYVSVKGMIHWVERMLLLPSSRKSALPDFFPTILPRVLKPGEQVPYEVVMVMGIRPDEETWTRPSRKVQSQLIEVIDPQHTRD